MNNSPGQKRPLSAINPTLDDKTTMWRINVRANLDYAGDSKPDVNILAARGLSEKIAENIATNYIGWLFFDHYPELDDSKINTNAALHAAKFLRRLDSVHGNLDATAAARVEFVKDLLRLNNFDAVLDMYTLYRMQFPLLIDVVKYTKSDK